jgi:hypothetical protein
VATATAAVGKEVEGQQQHQQAGEQWTANGDEPVSVGRSALPLNEDFTSQVNSLSCASSTCIHVKFTACQRQAW